jgi:hypothetical protein
MLIIANNKTQNQKGTHQVAISGHDEKWTYTACVATTPKGGILPFQQVWSRVSKASLPTENATGMAKLKALGFHFAFTKSKKKASHFSTFKTMAEWVEFILQSYILEQIEILGLEADQKSILDLDVYPVHIGQEFRTFLHEKYPNIMLTFVPAHCTT